MSKRDVYQSRIKAHASVVVKMSWIMWDGRSRFACESHVCDGATMPMIGKEIPVKGYVISKHCLVLEKDYGTCDTLYPNVYINKQNI